jgi:Derlin-2/3
MQSIEEWYRSLPVVTRTYVTLASLTTAGCALEVSLSFFMIKQEISSKITPLTQIITPFNVYFNTKLIMQGQFWRLLTNFFFFGNLGESMTNP